ncbi:hypothetical protein PNK_0862 [Candidatus Protochlamydia naegleriophila]|uniref:Uncharacterized protein n=1 Tax=Candidatus Protochlamydia naegleriophila TaxID=389348 RepID=A0A0U5JBI1_9BACT|nr:hypothetical protein [Candidatus Protochlamydia naegleriophila]CUI16487.1 hypothetical protein PNK_0862 [Candidatus Protochlamydia naegleriophila]
MSTPPISPRGDVQSNFEVPELDNLSIEPGIKQTTTEKAQETLDKSASHFSAWKPWTWSAPTWLKWGESEKIPSKGRDDIKEDQLDDELDLESKDSEDESDMSDVEVLNDVIEFKHEVPTVESDSDLLLNIDAENVEEENLIIQPRPQRSAKQPNLTSTAEKTDQTSYSHLWGVLNAVGSGVLTVGSAVKSATTYVAKKGSKVAFKAYASYFVNKQDKAKLLSTSHQRMILAGAGPQFVELSNFVSALLEGIAKNKMDSIPLDPHAVKDLIDINIANAFANLAVQMKQNKDSIHNFDNQPALASMISLFVKKVEAHIDPARMSQLEEQYREHRKKQGNLLKKLFPNLNNEPEKQKILSEWVTTGNLSDNGRKVLFPEFEELSEFELSYLDGEYAESDLKNRWEDASSLMRSMETAHKRHLELKTIFKPVIEDVLAYLLPNRTNDIIVPFSSILNISFVQNYLYNKGSDMLTEMLVKAYNPLENDATRRHGWEAIVHARVGDVNIDGIIDAPASLLVNGAKTYIQADPSVVDRVEEALTNALKKQQDPKTAEAKETLSKEGIVAKMSQGQLASWIVESAQALLHTEDPHVLKAGLFVQDVLHNLTLALVAQGSALVISDEQPVEQDKFIKELVDGAIAKFKSLQTGESIPDQFWIDFTKQLPLPAEVIEYFTPKLIEQAKSLQKTLTESAPDIQVIQSLHATVVEKVQTYKGGDQFLAISQAIADQVVDGILAKNIDLASSSEALGATLEELFSVYLPDVKFDNTLKEWFKNNVSALGVKEGEQETGSAILLKQGVQAGILKALINTIESNFKDDGEDYAAQLLKNIHQAFEKALPEFTAEQKVIMQAALGIQGLIQSNEQKIAELRKLMATLPSDIEPTQLQLIQNFLQATARGVRADNYVESLTKEKFKIFEQLNVNSTVVWNDEQLGRVREAIAFRKGIQPQLEIEKEARGLVSDLAALKILRAKLIDKSESIQDPVELNQIQQQAAHCEVLIRLLELPKERLKLVSDALNIEKTLEHAAKELEYILADIDQKEKLIRVESRKVNLPNAEAWKVACDWMIGVMTAQERINELTRENKDLIAQLDTHLEVFRNLAQELSILLGLDQKEKLQLPESVQDKLWKHIEEAKKTQLARLLFEQITPMILPAIEADSNRQKLGQLGDGGGLLAKLAQAASKGLVKEIPNLITSYRPFAQSVLILAGIENPSNEQIVEMENALNGEMLDLGRSLLTFDTLKPHLKGEVAEEELQRLAQGLFSIIRDEGLVEARVREVLAAGNRDMDAELLDKKAHQVAAKLRHFLIQLGKTDLNSDLVIQAYEKATDTDLEVEAKIALQTALKDQQVVEKIKKVQFTPERIAELLNDAIPGATNLHALMAPQLQAVLSGSDPAFQANWGLVERYVEGMLLAVFVKLAEVNDGEQSLEAIAGKLKELIQNPAFIRGKSREEAAQLMIDELMVNVLGIKSERDLPGVPGAVQKMAYDVIKEQAYLQLSPLLFPAIEKAKNKERVRQLSGSKMFGNLATAISKDIFSLAPVVFGSARPIAERIFVDLAERAPTSEELTAFSNKLVELAGNLTEQPLTSELLAEAFLSAAPVQLDNEEEVKADLVRNLEERGYAANIRTVLEQLSTIQATPEELTESLQQALPQIDNELKQELADKLHAVTRPGEAAYKDLSGFASEYVEGMILRLFMRIAEKNPPADGKDSLVVLLENLLAVVERKFQEAKTLRDIEGVQQLPSTVLIAQELNDEIFKDILGIDSEDALNGLPEPMKKQVYDLLKDQLGQLVLKIHEGIHKAEETLSAGNVKEDLKRFGIDQASQEAYATIIARDVAHVVIGQAVPHFLTKSGDNGIRVVNQIVKGVDEYLEELARGNVEVARVLLNYTRAPALKGMLQDQMGRVAQSTNLPEEKMRAANFVNDLVLVNLNRLFAKTVDFEEAEGAQFNRKLMGNILLVATNHIKTLNEAQKMAKAGGRANIAQADFLAAAGGRLHSAIPVQPITYDRSVALINERLLGILTVEQQARLKEELTSLMKQELKGDLVFTHKILIKKIEDIRGEPLSKAAKKRLGKLQDGKSVRDVIREEANAHQQQRKEFFGDSATKTLLSVIFPNGKNDLDFIDEALRKPVWQALKKDIFPSAINQIVETVLEESMLKEIVSSSLDSTLETLNGEVEIDFSIPDDPSYDQLDHVSGEFMSALIDMLELPALIKKQIKNPKTGEINPSVKESLGASLRKQFDGQFIKKSLEKALESAAKRDPVTGEPTIKFDASTGAEKIAKDARRIPELDAKIKQQTYDVADASVTYFIRSTWKAAQYKFDQLVEKAFGKIGKKFKNALDAVFGFIFFKVIGTVLGFLFTQSGLEAWLRKKFHEFLSLDANRERILNWFTKIPEGQPVDTHVLANEDLVYKIAGVLQETVEETLRERRVTP